MLEIEKEINWKPWMYTNQNANELKNLCLTCE